MPSDRCDLLCLDLPKAQRLRERRLTAERASALSGGFKALADPTRLTVAAALEEGEELCVCDLSWITGRAENLVSHHLRALAQAGLVERRRDGKMVMYSLNARGHELVGVALARAGSPG